ncbi:MAG: hypothetical protein WD876_01545 [Candidatus Pacearchaeota archaeon]
MKKEAKLAVGFFALFLILSAYVVFAASWNLVPSTASAGDIISLIAFNVSSTSHANSSNVSNVTSVLINITGTEHIRE